MHDAHTMDQISFSLGLLAVRQKAPSRPHPMPIQITHSIDTIVSFGTPILAAASGLLVTDAAPDSMAVEMRLLLLPFIGGMAVCGALMMLNPAPETRKIVMGRVLFSVLFGVLSPQILGMFHPSLASAGTRPVMLLFVGAAVTGLLYVLSKPFVGQLYARAERVAAREADRIEGKWSPPTKDKDL